MMDQGSCSHYFTLLFWTSLTFDGQHNLFVCALVAIFPEGAPVDPLVCWRHLGYGHTQAGLDRPGHPATLLALMDVVLFAQVHVLEQGVAWVVAYDGGPYAIICSLSKPFW